MNTAIAVTETGTQVLRNDQHRWPTPRCKRNLIAPCVSDGRPRAYLTAPMSLHDTPAYDHALALIRVRHRHDVVMSARDVYASRCEWLRRREFVLSRVSHLYIVVGPDGRIGSGVGWELAYVRHLNPGATMRAFKALAGNEPFTLSAGPAGAGYRIAGTWPNFSDYRSWDTGPSLARIIFERPALSLVTGTTNASRSEAIFNPSQSGDTDDETWPA